MNRVVIQSGYSMPFAGASKKRRGAKRRSRKSFSPAQKRAQANMKSCAKSWKTGSYQAHIARCLKAKSK